MKKIEYFKLIKQALVLTWRNRLLWIFGFLIFLGSFPANFNATSNFLATKFQRALMSSNIENNHLVVVMIFIALFIFVLLLFVVRIIGAAALIKMANNIEVYKQAKIINIISEVKKFIGRLLIVEVIIIVTMVAIAAILLLPILYLFNLNAPTYATLSLVFALLIALPLFVLAYFLRRYSYIYLVLGEMKVKMAIESAYSLLQKNVKESIIMGVIALLSNILLLVAAFFAIVVVLIICSPFIFAAYYFFAQTGAIVGGLIASIVIAAMLVVIICFYESFLQILWVLFFQEITLKKDDQKEIEEELQLQGEIPTPEAV